MAGGPYRIVSVGRALGIGLEGSHEVTLQAVAKRNSAEYPYCVPNEMICGEIGRFLRLPVPPCGIIHAQDTEPPHWFASLDFNLLGEELPPINPADCALRLPDVSTGILIFDLLVGNMDRHARNLSMDTSSKLPSVNAFDHGMTLFGSVQDEAVERLKKYRNEFQIVRHCLLKHIATDSYFDKWLSRVEELPDFFVREICNETVGLGVNQLEANAGRNFLIYRRDNIRRLVSENRARFSGIRNWSLLT